MQVVYIYVCIVDFISIWTRIIPSSPSRRLCDTFNPLHYSFRDANSVTTEGRNRYLTKYSWQVNKYQKR